MTKILIVSKDLQLTRVLQNTLSFYGFIVECAAHQTLVEKYLTEVYFGLILLDYNFHEDHGTVFYQKINGLVQIPPVVMMGECYEEIEILKLMYQNMDDYILRPFSVSELKMIINRQLDRRRIMLRPIVFGDLKIDAAKSLVFFKDKILSVGIKEFEALIVLTRRAGRIVVNDRLFTKDRIEALRKKLKAATDECLDIKSVSGLGYKLVDLGR